MIKIHLNYTDWKSNVTTKKLEHYNYIMSDRRYLLAVDGQLVFMHQLDQDDEQDYVDNFESSSNKKMGNFYQREPFATKFLKTGEMLFRRKHGKKVTIPANDKKVVTFEVPYTKCKINKLEVIDANKRDRVDLKVRDSVMGIAQLGMGVPPAAVEANKLLNQFGFDVVVCDLLYSDKSDYDADLYQGMIVEITYYNDTPDDKEVGFNIIFHELVGGQ
jgi:hypothetical protein